MSNRSAAKKTAWDQPGLFGDDQPDLFGAGSAREAYVPKRAHVLNSLNKLVGEMERAESWPWPASLVRRRRDGWLEHLCTLLPDAAERKHWRARIAVQVARLDAATPNERCEPETGA